MKGIILAGGKGTRLYPLTYSISKQLLPVYNKPMIYYPLSVLMLAKIRDILIISTEKDLPHFQMLLGDGSDFGINLSYAIQNEPKGLAEAFIIGKDFIGNNRVSLVLGDNIFYGQGFTPVLENVRAREKGATVFVYKVNNPSSFGIVEFDKNDKILSIEEKPKNPKSNYAATGLYFYDNKVVDYAKSLKPSPRGELEITDINRIYLEDGELNAQFLGRGFAWLDTGTFESLIDAGQFIQTIEKRQGLQVACLEEIAYKNKWLSAADILKRANNLNHNEYGKYLFSLIENEELK